MGNHESTDIKSGSGISNNLISENEVKVTNNSLRASPDHMFGHFMGPRQRSPEHPQTIDTIGSSSENVVGEVRADPVQMEPLYDVPRVQPVSPSKRKFSHIKTNAEQNHLPILFSLSFLVSDVISVGREPLNYVITVHGSTSPDSSLDGHAGTSDD